MDPEHRKINEDMEAAYSRIAAEDVQKPVSCSPLATDPKESMQPFLSV